MAATLKIRIGASIDNSLKFAFRPLQKSAEDARKAVTKELRLMRGEARASMLALGKEIGAGARAGAVQGGRELARLPRDARQSGDRVAKEMGRAWREIGKAAQAATRQQYRELKAQERNAQRSAQRQAEAFARRTSHRATRFLLPNAPIGSMAKRAASDIAQGAGVRFDIGSAVQRKKDLESASVKLSNQGFQAGDAGANGKRVGGAAIEAEARKVGEELNLDPQAIVEAMTKFTDITGDLDAARKSIREIGRTAIASGADIGDVAEAAGQVGLKMDGLPDKGKAINDVMRTFAGQGKLGAVELKDLAVSMGKLTASASQYEGDRTQVIKKLGGFGQLARQYGGATSGAEAATAVARFGDQLNTPARRAAMRRHGVDFENKQGQLRDPLEIMKSALIKTGGDTEKMNSMFKSTVAGKMVNPLANIFKGAGGGEAGLAAVDKAMEKFTKAGIGDKEVDDAIAERNTTIEARAQKFQNELDKVTSGLVDKLLPALEKAGPDLIKFAETVGRVVTWVAENPKKAIAIAITASIARAGIESSFRAGIERLILGPNGADGKPGTGRANAVSGAANHIGAAFALATAAITITSVGMMAIDSVAETVNKSNKRNVEEDMSIFNLETLSKAQGGKLTPEQRASAEKQLAELQGRQKNSSAKSIAREWAPLTVIWDLISGGKGIEARVGNLKDNADSGKTEAAIKQLQAVLASGTLNVKVTNMPEDGPKAASPTAGMAP